ncbi:hypothetical protein BHM03_00062618, partial [Ensete ventricosum]
HAAAVCPRGCCHHGTWLPLVHDHQHAIVACAAFTFTRCGLYQRVAALNVASTTPRCRQCSWQSLPACDRRWMRLLPTRLAQRSAWTIASVVAAVALRVVVVAALSCCSAYTLPQADLVERSKIASKRQNLTDRN